MLLHHEIRHRDDGIPREQPIPMNTNTYYSLDDADGNQITTGLPEQTAHRTAQRIADESGAPAYLYANDSDDGEELAPSSVDVLLDTPNGPLVEYGGHTAEVVEAEIPEGYSVDWSSAIEISVTGTHTLRFRAPLVCEVAS